jgi:acyl-CoA reductase-like NAD-dependent aldehyde dehydrogenase
MGPLSVAIDGKVARLAAGRARWGALAPSGRLVYLRECLRALQYKVDDRAWVEESAALQGWDVSDRAVQANQVATERFTVVSGIKEHLETLIAIYSELVRGGDRYDAPRARKLEQSFAHDGRVKVHAPVGFTYGLLGLSVDVYLGEGHTVAEPRPMNAWAGKLCVCFAAGNQLFLTTSDLLHKVFVDGAVVLVKHHPIRAGSEPHLSVLLARLIADGFVEQCHADAAEASALAADPRIEALHMTGGKPTHDAIVRTVRAAGFADKPFTSELGNVTPWIVTSGGKPWTTRELENYAGALVTGLVAQQSCNCLSPKALVLDADWPQCAAFIDCLRATAKRALLPPAYYPGTRDRYERFRAACAAEPGARCEVVDNKVQSYLKTKLSGAEDARSPLQPLLVFYDDVEQDPVRERYALCNEAFAPVLAVVTLKGANAASTFLPKAVAFVNAHVFGTLTCTLVVRDEQRRAEPAVQRALDDLQYGSVCVNTWSILGFAALPGVWGAYPGETLDTAASGIGFVHNGLMLNGVNKAVVSLPFNNPVANDSVTPPAKPRPAPVLANRLADVAKRPTFFGVLALARLYIGYKLFGMG